MKIGIDLGISSTKLVVFEQGKPIQTQLWEGLAPSYLITDYLRSLPNIEKITLTGVGSKGLEIQNSTVEVQMVDEFEANAKAARWYCHEHRFVVVSMGSGTSFVLLDGKQSKHLGGSALGGSALKGLMKLLLPGIDFDHFCTLSASGSLQRIDLQIGDVSKVPLPNLPLDATATNFGKASNLSQPADIAAGLENLILQNIGVMAYLAGKGYGIKHFVLIGRMTTLPHALQIFQSLEQLYGIEMHVPEQATFMTALGAAL